MDDFNLSSLSECRNEWISRLMNMITPFIKDGFDTIFNDAYQLCIENDEDDKYLMTFQNFISRIPKWNDELINNEVNRIIENSACGYLEDLITCVHITQLKALTCIRVGQKQKKIDIDIPKFKDFILKVYILVARKLYSNIYLFEKDIAPLQIQKNKREFELIIKDSIIDAVRESIPVEQILRSYLDETTEEDIEVEEIIEQETKPVVSDDKTITREADDMFKNNFKLKTNDSLTISKDNIPVKLDTQEINDMSMETPLFQKKDVMISDEAVQSNSLSVPSATNVSSTTNVSSATTATSATIDTPVIDVDNPSKISASGSNENDKNIAISFNNIDTSVSTTGIEEQISAPKNIERLEKIANDSAERRKLEEMEDLDDDEKLTIGEPINFDLDTINQNPILNGVEVLA